eukprot:scaffold96532_cov43-Attheya_sp.AAC.4
MRRHAKEQTRGISARTRSFGSFPWIVVSMTLLGCIITHHANNGAIFFTTAASTTYSSCFFVYSTPPSSHSLSQKLAKKQQQQTQQRQRYDQPANFIFSRLAPGSTLRLSGRPDDIVVNLEQTNNNGEKTTATTTTRSQQEHNEQEDDVVGLLEGIYPDFQVKKLYQVPEDGLTGPIFEGRIKPNLSISKNGTLPLALMVLDPETYPTLSKARKAIRHKQVLIQRHDQDAELNVSPTRIYDPKKAVRGLGGDRIYPLGMV